MTDFWRAVDLRKLKIPGEVLDRKDAVCIKHGNKIVENANIFYRDALPPVGVTPSAVNLLLLHGMRFSSKTWLELGTLNMTAAFGYRTIAIDLPGFANSPAVEVEDNVKFLSHLIECFDIKNPVIVSPSLSGLYAIPYLLQHSKNMAGYIPVAPSVAEAILDEQPKCNDVTVVEKVYEPLRKFLQGSIPDLSHIETPTMVVFGEKDRTRVSALLNLLPNSQCQEIPNAGHPAYLDDPELWHQILYNFLHHVSKMYN